MKKKILLILATFAVALFAGTQDASAKTDVTDTYLQNANLSSLKGWTIDTGFGGSGYTDYKTDGDKPVIEFYHSWSWNAGAAIGSTKTFDFSQKTTLPAGYYRLKVNAFYREGNGNGANTKALIYATTKTDGTYDYSKYVVGLPASGLGSYSGSNDLYKAANAFSKGDFANEFDFDVETDDTEVTIGFHGYIDTYCSWCILGPVTLYKYEMSDFAEDFNKKATAAKALYDKPMNAVVLQNLKDKAEVDPSSWKTKSEITAAEAALDAAISAANASIAIYTQIAAINCKAEDLDAAGQASYASTLSAYNNGTLTSVAEAETALRNATLAQTTAGSNFTDVIVNNSFEKGNTDGWTLVDAGGAANNGNFGKATGSWFVEKWNPSMITAGTLSQSISGLPNGAYTLSAEGQLLQQNDNTVVPEGYYLTANGYRTPIVAAGTYSVLAKVTDGTLTIGTVIEDCTGNWACIDDFRLVYEGAPIAVTDITITGESTMEVGKTQTLTSVVEPANASFPAVTYSSNTPTIATVDPLTGLVTAVSEGTVTITATADGFNQNFTITVTVPAVTPTTVTLSESSLAIAYSQVGGTTPLTATVGPDGASQDVIWTTSNAAVATVDTGVITFVGVGSATIKATASGYPDVFGECKVTVSPAPAPSFYSEIEAGQFILQNAATGMFLGQGNNWGTKASLVKHPVLATLSGSEGTYKITDVVASSNGLGADCFVDNGTPVDLTATKLTNGAYTLTYNSNLLAAAVATTVLEYRETNAENPYAQWFLINKEDAKKLWADATENPTDLTYLLRGANFDRNNGYYGKWTFDASSKANGGTNENFCVESYHSTFNMYQEIRVPNGTYTVSVQGFYRQDGTDNENLPYFYANSETQAFPKLTTTENTMGAASTSFLKGNYSTSFDVTVTDGKLKVGAKLEDNTSLWCIWDNFSIVLKSDVAYATLNVDPANKWATFYAPFAVDVPADVYSYAITVNEDVATRAKFGGDAAYTLPAETPVLVYNSEGISKTYYDGEAAGEPVAAIGENMLVGTAVSLGSIPATAGKTNYVLQNGKNGIAWYPAISSNTLPANRAYLSVPDGIDVKGIFDFTTGINEVREAALSEGMYNMAGQKVGADYKGVVIKNGKKMLNK